MFDKKEVKTAGVTKRESRRRKRGIHGRARQKLTAPKIEGYYTRFVNDVDNKLHDALMNDDYDHVLREEINDNVGDAGDGNSDLGSQVRVLVDKDEHGNPVHVYLLKKPIDYHEADLKENEKERLERESVLHRGNDKIENQYGSIT